MIRTKPRHGFTLIELLVVITIIGILMSMLFPALDSSREMARRNTCSRNLAEIGVALQNYEAANGVYPSGTINPQGPIHSIAEGQHVSWLVQLLPYLDEPVTYNHIDLAAGVYDVKNAAVRRIRIAKFVCPSEPYPDRLDVGLSTYVGCCNDVEAPIDSDNHGVLFLNSKIRPKDVTDGLAHTIFVGEKHLDRLEDDLGWISGTRATLRDAGVALNFRIRKFRGGPDLPPQPGDAEPELKVGGFGSAHMTGAQFLFGDGAVRFLDDSVSVSVLQQLANRSDGTLVVDGPTRKQP